MGHSFLLRLLDQFSVQIDKGSVHFRQKSCIWCMVYGGLIISCGLIFPEFFVGEYSSLQRMYCSCDLLILSYYRAILSVSTLLRFFDICFCCFFIFCFWIAIEF